MLIKSNCREQPVILNPQAMWDPQVSARKLGRKIACLERGVAQLKALRRHVGPEVDVDLFVLDLEFASGLIGAFACLYAPRGGTPQACHFIAADEGETWNDVAGDVRHCSRSSASH